MKKIDYQPNALSHHNENIQYWVTQGIVIDGERYSVEELFIRSGDLYGVLSKDKITFYEHQLSSNVVQSSYDDKEVKYRISRLETKEIPRYDDTGIQKRITDLENRDNSEISNIKDRLSNIENKEDNDNQTLIIEDNTLSISGGNSVKLPNYPKYDDSGIKKRLYDLENKEDKDNQTLTINGNTLSISNGNSVELPKTTEYNDSALRERIEKLEKKPDNDKQTLSLEGNKLSISNGNSVDLPASSISKPIKVSSTSEGVTVTPEEEEGTTNYKVNIDGALDKYYDKSKTYTKNEVDTLLTKQEEKATDITVYKGKFIDRSRVKEGDYDTPISPRITLTYSSSTGVGIFKIDFKVLSGVPKGFTIAELPSNAPVPAELVESQVWVGNVSTSVWIDKGSRTIKISMTVEPEIFNKRIILNIPGIFKKS